MEERQIPNRRISGWAIALASVLLALVMTITLVQGLSAQTNEDEQTPTATPTEPVDGGGAGSALEASLTSTLTVEVTPTAVITATVPVTATVEASPTVPVTITPTEPPEMTPTVPVETTPTASAVTTPTVSIEPTDSVTVTIFMPVIRYPLPIMSINATRPNSSNQWQIQWQNIGAGITYRLQESQRPDFATLTLDQSVAGTSKGISHAATAFNTYYYRLRAEGDGQIGPWSSTLSVTGAYLDDFSNPSTGWAVRRTTFLEETVSWYGDGDNAGNFIIVVADRWDWMIASPLQAAPKPPYVLEYRARVHDASNLVSGGVVLGGDWNFEACPEIGNVYKTDNCFNHFYNFNYIHYGAMKLLFEQIDELYWCPGCGGSPLKRLGDESNWREIDPIFPNGTARNWHTYRIEVRDTGLSLTIDGEYKGQFGTPAYVNEPFFGVFASTDEYKPSIWFFDYYKLTPLDS